MPVPPNTVADFFVFGADSAPEQEFDPAMIGRPNGQLAFAVTDDLGTGNLDRQYVVYNADGSHRVNVQPLSATIDEQHLSLAATPSGFEIRAWMEKTDATGEQDIYAEVRAPSTTFGTTIVNRFLVNTGRATGIQDRPEVTAFDDDRFLVSWINRSTGNIDAAIYEIGGDTSTSPFELSLSNAAQDALTPTFRFDMATLSNGNAVVAYRTDAFDAKYRIVSPDGTVTAGEFDFDGVAGNNGAVAVETLADGRFVMLAKTGSAINGRIFNTNGTPATDVFNVFAIAGDLPQVAALSDGRFIAVEQLSNDIRAQVMFADGTKDGADFAVNTVTTGVQSRPTVAAMADGRVAISWQSDEAGSLDLKAAIYDPRTGNLNASASSLADDWVGTGLADTVYMGNGNDNFAGGLGNDVVFGEEGLDTLKGNEGSDRLVGGLGNDTLEGGVNNDNLSGGLGDDTLRGNENDDTLSGGEGSDIAFGGIGNDIVKGDNGDDASLNGEDGNDAVHGGNGDDMIDGGNNKDTLDGDANNDVISGGGDGDTLRGGLGDDRQFGGLGNDVHLGGAGLDTFVFTDDTEGNDRVDDWLAGDDQIEIDASAFGGGLAPFVGSTLAADRLVLGSAPTATQPFGQFLYNTTNGQLLWDVDGTGAAAAVAITRLLNGGVAVTTLAVADFDIVA